MHRRTLLLTSLLLPTAAAAQPRAAKLTAADLADVTLARLDRFERS